MGIEDEEQDGRHKNDIKILSRLIERMPKEGKSLAETGPCMYFLIEFSQWPYELVTINRIMWKPRHRDVKHND